MVKCPKCGEENLDFKIFCGYCGASLRNFQEPAETPQTTKDSIGSKPINSHSKSLSRELRDSAEFGALMFFSPIILTALIYPIANDLASIYPEFYILRADIFYVLLLELAALIGIALFGVDEWAMGRMDFPMRMFVGFFLFFSLSAAIILESYDIFGHATNTHHASDFPGIIAGVEFFLIFIFVIWLLFFGWLREIKPSEV